MSAPNDSTALGSIWLYKSCVDLPAFCYWLSPSSMFALAAAIVGGVVSYLGLPSTLRRGLRPMLVVLLVLLPIGAAYNAALQDRDSSIVKGTTEDQRTRLRRIESKLGRLAAGLKVPASDDLEMRVDGALLAAADQRRGHIDAVVRTARAENPNDGGQATRPAQGEGETQTKINSVDRSSLLAQLTQLYILSHDGISLEMMAGQEAPPVDWLNNQLAERKANWRILSCNGARCETKAAR